jgi:hypothetical protein
MNNDNWQNTLAYNYNVAEDANPSEEEILRAKKLERALFEELPNLTEFKKGNIRFEKIKVTKEARLKEINNLKKDDTNCRNKDHPYNESGYCCTCGKLHLDFFNRL